MHVQNTYSPMTATKYKKLINQHIEQRVRKKEREREREREREKEREIEIVGAMDEDRKSNSIPLVK